MIYTIFKSAKSSRERWIKESKEIKAKKQGKYEKAEEPEPENVDDAKEIEMSEDRIPEVPITKAEDIPKNGNNDDSLSGADEQLPDEELPAPKMGDSEHNWSNDSDPDFSLEDSENGGSIKKEEETENGKNGIQTQIVLG